MTSYVLRISTEEKNYSELDSLFDYNNPKEQIGFWEYEITEEDIRFTKSIEFLTKMLEERKKEIFELGISFDDITIWYYYEYVGQCNMEFSPIQLKSIADLDITFCISCWEK